MGWNSHRSLETGGGVWAGSFSWVKNQDMQMDNREKIASREKSPQRHLRGIHLHDIWGYKYGHPPDTLKLINQLGDAYLNENNSLRNYYINRHVICEFCDYRSPNKAIFLSREILPCKLHLGDNLCEATRLTVMLANVK